MANGGVVLVKRNASEVDDAPAGKARVFVDENGGLAAKDEHGNVLSLDAAVADIEALEATVADKQDAASAATDAELLTEKDAREAADANEAKAREDADAAEATARKDADATEKAAREAADALLQPLANKGQANGYATLDPSGHVPIPQMPVGALTYKGTWDASTNTPELSDATGAVGEEYIVSTGGKRNLGSGSITFAVGSVLLHNGTIWEVIASPDAVSSVFGRQGAVTPQSGDYAVGDIAGLTSALSAKQDAATAATDAELNAAKAELEARMAAEILSEAAIRKLAEELLGATVIFPTDPRILNKIKVSSEGFADSNNGWTELLALAKSLGAMIILPPNVTYKFEKSWVLPSTVMMDTFGRNANTVLSFPNNLGVPTYAQTEAVIAVGATKIKVKGITGGGFASVGSPKQAFLATSNQMFTYTGFTSTGAETGEFTGVTGITQASAGSASVVQNCAVYVANGSNNRDSFGPGIKIKGPEAVTKTYAKETPPELMDGIWLGGGRRLNCAVAWFRILVGFTQDHQRIGNAFTPESGWCTLGWMGPRETAGNQLIEGGSYLNGCVWASCFVANGNLMSGVHFGFETLFGQCPWAIWKEKYQEGKAGATANIATGVVFDHPEFEALGLGIVGCPDGKGILEEATLDNPYALLYPGNTPEGQTPPAVFACQVKAIRVRRAKGLGIWGEGMQAFFLSDEVTGQIDELRSLVEVSTSHSAPFIKGKNVEFPTVKLKGETISALGREGMDAEIKLGHVLHRKHVSQARVGRYEKPIGVLGVAIADIQNGVVIFATTTPLGSTNERVKVKVLKQSTPPTAVSAEPSATAGTLEARKYFYRVAVKLSGGGIVAAAAEVSATAEAGKSIKLKLTNPAAIHGQTVTKVIYWRSTTSGVYSGRAEVSPGTEITDSGTAMSGTTTPTEKNEGCEIFGSSLVRTNASAEAGVACSASGPGDTNGVAFGYVYEGADNGETAEIFISPALL